MKRKSLLKKKKKSKDIPKENVYLDMELEAVEVKKVPDNQLELNDAELDEEFTKTLSCIDPNQPPKKIQFNFKIGSFESYSNNDHTAIHISNEGVIWSIKEEELDNNKKQKLKESEEAKTKPKEEEQENKNDEKDNENETDKDKTNDKEDDSKQTVDDTAKKDEEPLIKNQFNYSERASQTFNQPLRDRECQTEPAPKSVFSQNANAATIRDEYLINLLKTKQQKLEEENKKKKTSFGANNDDTKEDESISRTKNKNKIKHHDVNDAILHSNEMLKSLKIMERVTVLNAKSESYHNFRYWKEEDYISKPYLLILWNFKSTNFQSPGQMVTCLSFNKLYRDLFGVGYGSYSFNHQTNGKILIYSLKSTVHPVKIIHCESGVMCLSFHPKYSSLICCGNYDGSVAVYDIRSRDDSPIYSSSNPINNHTDPVWDIKWYHNELQHELTFYSISSDSCIKYWKITQNELNHETIIKLTTPSPSIQIESKENNNNDIENNDECNNLDALCCSFDFSPFLDHLYLVGTEDGHIMECSKTSTDGYTKLYKNAHFMNVYCVKWNSFYNKIFLSCSEDWTVKLWDISDEAEEKEKDVNNDINNDEDDDELIMRPVITYDLGCSVNDICWSPYSSTVFGAVTSDGKVHIFDLLKNKNYPICSQKISKSNLTKIKFPIGFPLIMVGDENGNIYALKLSPQMYLDQIKYRDILKIPSITMFNNEIFREKQKNILNDVLNVTGNKVLDLVFHLSPQKIINKKLFQSPNNKARGGILKKMKSPISSIGKIQ